MSKLIWMYLLPLLVVAVAAGGFFLAFSDTGAPRRRDHEGLLLLCDEALRYPLESPDIEHEHGAVGRFLRRTGLHVKAEYGPPRELLDELILTRAGDLFLAAGEDYLDRAWEAGLIYDTRKVALFVPVIMVRRNNPQGIETVSDLADPALRLALADERTSLMGAVTSQVLGKNGVSPGGLENVRFVGGGAAEVAAAVDADRADAAIIWRSAAAGRFRNTEIVDIPAERNVTSPLIIAVLETAADKRKATQFAEFLSGSAGREVFEMYGY